MELTVPARLRRAAERWPEATALVVRGPAGSLRVGFAELVGMMVDEDLLNAEADRDHPNRPSA